MQTDRDIILETQANEDDKKELIKKKDEDLIIGEEDELTSVGIKEFDNLLEFSVGRFGFFLYFFTGFLAAFAQLAPTYWLNFWTDATAEEQKQKKYPNIFIILIVVYLVINLLRVIVVFLMIIGGGNNMLKSATYKTLRSKIVFFDSNPIGRILTRFSKEIGMIDNMLSIMVVFASNGAFRAVSVAIAVAIISPFILIPLFFAMIIMILVFRIG